MKQDTKKQTFIYSLLLCLMVASIPYLMWRNFERNTQPKKHQKITTYQADSIYTSTIVGNSWSITEDSIINQ